MSSSLRPQGLQHTRLPCPSSSPGACPSSWPLNQWCHPTISSSVAFFFSDFNLSYIRVFSNESAVHIRWPKYWSFSLYPSKEYSVLFPLRLTGLISLFSKGLSRGFLNTTVCKHQLFSAPPSLLSRHDIGKTIVLTIWTLQMFVEMTGWMTECCCCC